MAYADRGNYHLRGKRKVSDSYIAKLHKLANVFYCLDALALECVARIYKHDNFFIGDVVLKQPITHTTIQLTIFHKMTPRIIPAGLMPE